MEDVSLITAEQDLKEIRLIFVKLKYLNSLQSNRCSLTLHPDGKCKNPLTLVVIVEDFVACKHKAVQAELIHKHFLKENALLPQHLVV